MLEAGNARNQQLQTQEDGGNEALQRHASIIAQLAIVCFCFTCEDGGVIVDVISQIVEG